MQASFDHNKVAATGFVNSTSIHPRVEGGRTKHKLVNTCMPTLRKKPTKSQENLLRRQRVWDALSGTQKASMSHRPGSFKK